MAAGATILCAPGVSVSPLVAGRSTWSANAGQIQPWSLAVRAASVRLRAESLAMADEM